MNEGYIACWLLTVAVILYLTGWKEHVAGDVSGRTMLAVLAAAVLLQPVTLQLGSTISIRGGAVVALGAASASVVLARRASQILYMLLGAVMTGFVWLWFRLMYASDPVFVMLQPVWDGPLVAGLMGGLLTDRFRYQFIVIVTAATASQFADLLRPAYGPNIAVIGSLGWWDGLAIALAASRLTRLMKNLIKRASARLLHGPSEERGG